MGTRPDWSFESLCGHSLVAGIDEAGRGPWAGPVVAAAVILNPQRIPDGIHDSKQLKAAKRKTLLLEIQSNAMTGVGIASVEEIDSLNILEATKLAMRRAVAALPQIPEFVLVDGNQLPHPLPCPARAIVEGDAKSLSIAAASIIAKVMRDRIMCDLARQHPEYGWERNAGYGTKQHQEALARFGITAHHRRSYAPIRRILESAAEQAA